MTNLHETGWQHMLKKATDEFHGIQGHFPPACAVGLSIPEGHLMMVSIYDPAVRYGHAMRVLSEVFQNLLGTTKRPLRIDNPIMSD